jgi:hypothetical protein
MDNKLNFVFRKDQSYGTSRGFTDAVIEGGVISIYQQRIGLHESERVDLTLDELKTIVHNAEHNILV